MPNFAPTIRVEIKHGRYMKREEAKLRKKKSEVAQKRQVQQIKTQQFR